MVLGWIDILIIIFYFVAMALIGVYFSRKNKSTEEYFVGGRSFPGWVIGLAMVGTSISSVTFVAYPGDTFRTSWIRYIINFGLPPAIIIAAFVFLPLFRRGKCFSAYEYLEARYGQSVRAYASIAFIISQMVRISIILYLLSLLVHEMTGLNPQWSILVAGVCVSLYTVMGGIDAVIWTDVIQTVLLTLGSVVCVVVVVMKVPGGVSEIISVAWEHGKLSFSEFQNGQYSPLPWGFSLNHKTVIMLFFLGFTNWMAGYCGNQTVVQKYFAVKNMKEARKSLYVTGYLSLPIWGFYMFIGTALYVFFHYNPAPEATEMLNGQRAAEQILPFFILNYLPTGVIGILIAAALAAAMSSLSAGINSITTCCVVDVYKRYIIKGKTDRHYLMSSWIIGTTVALLMITGAFILVNVKTTTLQDTTVTIVSVLSAGILSIYLIGFLTKLCDSRAIWAGIILTVSFTIWTILSKYGLLPEKYELPFDIYYTALIGNFIMLVTCLGAGLILGRKEPIDKGLIYWTIEKTDD